MNTKHLMPLFLIMSMAWAGCGDDKPTSDNNSKWGLDMLQEDMDVDMPSTSDMGADQNTSDMKVDVDMKTSTDMGVDMARDLGADMGVDTPPDMPPADPFVASLTRVAFLGVLELEAQGGSQAVGIAIKLKFNADMTVEVLTQTRRKASWQRLANGKIYLYDLPKENGMGTEELTFEPVLSSDKVTALNLLINANGETLPFEPLDTNTPDFKTDELSGKWQSIKTHTNQNNNTFHLAISIDRQSILEYGVLGADDVFRSFAKMEISTATFFDKRSFWYGVPPTAQPNMDIQPLAGQLLRSADGKVRFFAPVGEKDRQGNDVFYVYELRQVQAFKFRSN